MMYTVTCIYMYIVPPSAEYVYIFCSIHYSIYTLYNIYGI